MDYWLYQLEWVLRLFVAAICGGAVGYERKVRLKTAGIRTHMLVAVGAALFMIISKYGFFDLTGHATDISLDHPGWLPRLSLELDSSVPGQS